jgi:apolipoprotein N-acyltransferase
VPLRLAVAALAGVALGLSFEPARLVFLLPVAIAVLLWAVRGQTARRGALLGGVFGLAFFHVLLVWLRVLGSDAWTVLATAQSVYLALAGAGLAVASRHRGWPLWSAVVWVGVEVLRGSWPAGGLTWGRVAFATVDTPVEAWFPWLGTNGVGFVVVALSAALLWLVLEARESPRLAGGVVAAAAVVLTVPWVAQPPHETEGTATIALVQGDVPGAGDDLVSHHREVTDSHVELTRALGRAVADGDQAQPDFVVWPENSTAVDPFTDSRAARGIREAGDAVDVPILVGGIVDAPKEGQVLNQGIVVDPETGAGDRYTKRHPVPYGEYIPYRRYLGEWSSERLGLIPRDMVSGTRTAPLRIGGVEVADAICFDVAYDDAISAQVRRGAQLLVVQTSNAIFIHTGQIEQQFAISRLRALETGRSVAVAAVNGRTGVIDEGGEVVASVPARTPATLVQEVPLTTSVPPAMWVGPWLGRACFVAALGAGLWVLLPYRQGWSERRTRLTRPGESDDSTTAG